MGNKLMNGIWIKYAKEPGNWYNDKASYNKLYNDLKGTGVQWAIAQSKEECMDQLCGEFIANEGICPGDIYVYYEEYSEKRKPIFYIHVEEVKNTGIKGKGNHIFFNNCSLGYDGIDNKYMLELILKLYEIDKEKNEYYIKLLETRYENYKRVLSLLDKNEYTEEELLFLYYMAYIKGDTAALSKIKIRDVQKDYEELSNENKVKLFLNIKDSKLSDKLYIASKDILINIARNQCLKQFNNANEEIIKDKKFIMELLGQFFKSDEKALKSFELDRYLPEIYRTDIDTLEYILKSYSTVVSLHFYDWIRNNSKYEEIKKNPEFAYRLIDCYTRSLIDKGELYYRNSLLWLFNDEILNNIENHILIGPESTKEKENLKTRSLCELREDKEKVLSYRKKQITLERRSRRNT